MVFQEPLFERAIAQATGMTMATRRSSIPVGILSLQENNNWIPVARCFPDSQTVVSMDGRLLSYPTADGKTRAAVVWPNLGSALF